jgi:succinyl-diaminopimelate desuccinylase
VATSAFERVAKRIETYRQWAIDLQTKLTATRALDPASGGEGEAVKETLIRALLTELDVADMQTLTYPEQSPSACRRPNLVARFHGKDRKRALWIMSHMDVVPAGDLKDWQSDPWTVRVEGSRIYGRGVEDNQQGIVSSLVVARALRDEQIEPPCDLGLLFVADEETGNKKGIEFVLEQKQIFGPNDLIVVPDGGIPDGTFIEVAEKGIGWVRCNVRGRATHGSTPEKGVNAHRAAAHMIVRLEQLHERFNKSDEVFDPPPSTFPVTKGEAGAPNVNTIPGEHTFYLDCRVLPDYSLDEVLAAIREISSAVDGEHGTQTEITVVQRMDAAPATPADAPVVHALQRAIKTVYGVEGKPGGIGGGTVAACIRRKGYPVAVWAKLDETMHGPNEYCDLDNLLGDAKVFAHVLLEAMA